MSSAGGLHFFGKSSNPEEQEYLYMVFTKTQYAGWQIHILIVKLMLYIFKKYLLDVKVMDEGDYWCTNDEALLKKNFKINGALISSFVAAVESFPLQDGETMEAYFLRMME